MRAITTIGLDIAESVISGLRRRSQRQGRSSAAVEAGASADVFQKAAALPIGMEACPHRIIGRASCRCSATLSA